MPLAPQTRRSDEGPSRCLHRRPSSEDLLSGSSPRDPSPHDVEWEGGEKPAYGLFLLFVSFSGKGDLQVHDSKPSDARDLQQFDLCISHTGTEGVLTGFQLGICNPLVFSPAHVVPRRLLSGSNRLMLRHRAGNLTVLYLS